MQMGAPAASEAAAKARWLAKLDAPSFGAGKVVPTAAYGGNPMQRFAPPPPNPQELYMPQAWATDNYSAGSKAAHIASHYVAPGMDHDHNNELNLPRQNPGLSTPEMPQAWATDNFAEGSKAAHIASHYDGTWDDHSFNSWSNMPPQAATNMPRQVTTNMPRNMPRQDTGRSAPEMTTAWATDNFAEGSKAAHVASHYDGTWDDHSFTSWGSSQTL